MLKNILITIAVLLLLAVGWGYFELRSRGLMNEPVYDTVAPAIPELEHPAILVLHKTNGFVHKEGLPAAGAMLADLAEQQGWHIFQTDNAASHNAADLARFDVVVWNNTSGDILTPAQRADFRAWLEGGGRWLGLHAAGGDPSYDWQWYVDRLLGAQFIGHTMSPQFQDADVLSVDPSPLTRHLPSPWRVAAEEWYAFDRNPRETGSSILLAMDESSYDTEETFFPDASMPGEHPIAWTHPVGEGRVVYSAIGHTAATYALPAYQQFLVNAVDYLLERTP